MPLRRISPWIHQNIIVGGYGEARGARPPGYGAPYSEQPWVEDRIGWHQRVWLDLMADYEYTDSHGNRVRIYRVREGDSRVLERTLDQLPPSHLEIFTQRKPEGILMVNSAGRGGSERYTGGLNYGVDIPATPFNEEEGIVITYGAMWRYRDSLGICPTIFHEIGHGLTHGPPKISYWPFERSRNPAMRNRARALKRARVSRNGGPMEALCNAYMYFICYGSPDPVIHNFGSPSGRSRIQGDALTRRGLRLCPAFSSMLNGGWLARFRER